MSTELTEAQAHVPEDGGAVQQSGAVEPQQLIAQAIQQGMGVDGMERLLAMRRELKAEQDKEAFFRALSDFQAECPEIPKTKAVYQNGKVRYRYAPLDVIVSAVKDLLKQHGFSYTIYTDQDEDGVTAICRAHHEQGHSEETRFRIPIDKNAHMNAPQKVASALTYAKRYAFCNAFGILTTDQDDDAQVAGEQEPKQPRQQPKQAQEPRQQGPQQAAQESQESPLDAAYRITHKHIKSHEDASNLGEDKLYELYQELDDAYEHESTDWMRSLYRRVGNIVAQERRKREREELDVAAEQAFESGEPERSAVESQLPDESAQQVPAEELF